MGKKMNKFIILITMTLCFINTNIVLAQAIKFNEVESYIESLNSDSPITVIGFINWNGNNVKRVMYHLYATPKDAKQELYSDVIVLMGASPKKRYYDLSMCKGNYVEVQGTVSTRKTNPQFIIYNLISVKAIDKFKGNKNECLQYYQ